MGNNKDAAKTSGERFVLAFHSNLAGLSISRLHDGLIIDVNDEWLKIFGFARQEVVGKIVADKAWRNADQRKQIVRELQQQGAFRDRELTFRRTSGEEFTALTSARVGVLHGEKIFILSMIDITARKRAEKELQESEQRYRALAETSPDAIIVHRQNTFLYANPAALNLYGADHFKQLKEKPVLDLIDPDERGAILSRLKLLQSGEQLPLRETRLLRLDGRQVQVEAYASNIMYGESQAVQVQIRDITQRKVAEEALWQSREAYRSLLENSPDNVDRVDREFRHLYVNAAAANVFGLRPEQIIGKTNRELGTPERYAQMWEERIRRVFDTGQLIEYEDAFPGVTGVRFWQIRCVPERAADGTVSTVLAISRDITERKRAEVALQEANTELERKVRERTVELSQRANQLRALAGELTLSEQRERKRLANLLHDHLQQTLVAAKFRTAVLGRGVDDLARQAAREVEDLIDESIAASRSLTAELSPPVLHEVGLNAGMRWLAKRMADRQGLFVDLQMEDVGILADDLKMLLFESVRELLFNVVKHARTRSAAVTLRHVDGVLQITVSDEGIGFDPDMLAKAGESGGGFGLFGVHERLELFGGRMEIDSTPGQGSRIVLSAPVTQAAAAVLTPKEISAQERTAQAAHIAAPVAGRKIRIVLADDHKIVRQGISNLISNEPDLEIIGQAGDGREAVECAARLMPDVILMDMSMPKLDGIEATRIIHESHPGIHILGLSMYEEAERAQAMRAAGAVDYLSKSGPAEELINAIRKSVRSSPKTARA